MKAIIKTNAITTEFKFPDAPGKLFHRAVNYEFESWMTKYPEYFSVVTAEGKVLGRADEIKTDEPTAPVVPEDKGEQADEIRGIPEETKSFAPESVAPKIEEESDVPDEENVAVLDEKVHADMLAQLEKEAAAEEAETEVEPDKVSVEGYKAVHKGFGKWVIEDESGAVVMPTDGTFLKKAEAAEVVATMI